MYLSNYVCVCDILFQIKLLIADYGIIKCLYNKYITLTCGLYFGLQYDIIFITIIFAEIIL